MYDHLLVPTDGGEHAEAAARHALALADVHDANVRACYVVDTEPGWLAVSKAEVSATLREVGMDAGREALATIESLAEDHDASFTTDLREGSPAEQIVAAADEAGADLIVMGTHGRSGVAHSLLGSVAERVIRDAPVPVTTLRADADRTQY